MNKWLLHGAGIFEYRGSLNLTSDAAALPVIHIIIEPPPKLLAGM